MDHRIIDSTTNNKFKKSTKKRFCDGVSKDVLPG